MSSNSNSDKLASIPSVMLTTEGNQETIQHGGKFKVRRWLVKPFQTENY